jgi:hypothetical protein
MTFVVVVIITVIVVAAVIFMVPVAFLHVPAISLMLIVRVIPVGSLVRGTLPDTGYPDVAASVKTPITINPGITLGGRWRAALVTNRWRRASTDNDAEANLSKGWCG